MKKYIEKIIDDHVAAILKLQTADFRQQIASFAQLCIDSLSNDKRIYFCGNGGSAADSQHLAAEFVGRFETERRSLPAMALTVNTSALTAIGNDYGYDAVFARQVQGLVVDGDLVVGLSTSGNSQSIITALQAAKKIGARTVGLTGEQTSLMDDRLICDLLIKVPSVVTARIQEMHILIGHIVCGLVDRECSHNRV